MPKTLAPRAHSRIQSAIELLEPRQLMSAYFIATDADFASLSSKSLAAGDVVLLKGGATFHGRLTLDASDTGTEAKPITVTSYDAATMQAIAADAPASARATISAGKGDGILGYNTAGVNIVGLNIVGSGANTNTGAGIDFYTNYSGNTKLAGVTIDHVDVSGFGSNGVEFGSGVDKSGFADVSLTYVTSHDNGNAGITTYGQFDASSTTYANQNVYIGYCSAYNNAGVIGSNSPTGSGIVLGDVNGATIEFTTAYNNGANNTASNGPVGIWVYDSNAVTIQYNESYNNQTAGGDGGGFDLDGGVTNSVMQYNYAHDNDGVGFGLYQYSGARTWANNTVRYNVSANNSQKDTGPEISLWTNGTGMSNAQVYGNKLYPDSSVSPILLNQSSISASVHDNVIQIGGVVDTTGAGITALTAVPVATPVVVVTTPVTTPVADPAPVDTTPVDSTPVATTPVTTPVDTTPVVSADPVTTPVDASTPVVTTPVVTTPVVNAPVDTTTPVTVTTTKHRVKHRHHARN